MNVHDKLFETNITELTEKLGNLAVDILIIENYEDKAEAINKIREMLGNLRIINCVYGTMAIENTMLKQKQGA
jgi:hypothetical protein